MKTPMENIMKNFMKMLSFFFENGKERIELCLEPFLIVLSMELEMNQPFEEALKEAIKQTPNPLKKKLSQAVQNYQKHGASLEQNLWKINDDIQSPLLARTLMLLVHISTQGVSQNAIQSIRKVAETIHQNQQIALKTYTNTLTMASLVFIGVSALVPTLFLAFVTIGSSFLELTLTQMDILIITWVLFPTLDGIVLFFLWWKTPMYIKQGEAG